MPDLNIILENLRFQVLEVENQVNLTARLLKTADAELLNEINSKDDYIDNLKTTIEDKSFSYINRLADASAIDRVRAIHIICVNLERIGDFCVNVARQTQYLKRFDFMHRFDHAGMCDIMIEALRQILPVFKSRDLSGALEICHAELYLDQMYKATFDQIMNNINKFDKNVVLAAIQESVAQIVPMFQSFSTAQAFEKFRSELDYEVLYQAAFERVMGRLHKEFSLEDHITAIFIFRYLERIGDALLNIGEALVFSIIGDRIKIRQFEALERTLTESGFEGGIKDIEFRSILGSRSGCQISHIGAQQDAHKAQGIFKTGIKSKVRQEKDNIERWEEIYPGLAPTIYAFYERDENASMLVEFLPGCTLDEVILSGNIDIIRNAVFILENMLNDIWSKTKTKTPRPSNFIDQLQKRMGTILKVHPNFVRKHQTIEGFGIPSSAQLVEKALAIEATLTVPFTVFKHGDFNTNNIVYDHERQKINFIDLFRSGPGDYIQDASVLLISNFRLPFFKKEQRDWLNAIIDYFYRFFKAFAEKQADHTFELRMALAIARSFYTSTRFEMNRAFSKHMFLRAIYVLEKIAAHGNLPPEEFKLPEHVLYY